MYIISNINVKIYYIIYVFINVQGWEKFEMVFDKIVKKNK